MAATTGTVYGLVDPRDDQTRYVGQTKQPLATRLKGHCGGGRTSPRVRAWIAELRAASLKPQIVAIRGNVPASELRAAETAEITRIFAAGGALLNEQSTAQGREIVRLRREAEDAAAERAAWKELADAAVALLGGPLPPGDIPAFRISDEAWLFMSANTGYREFANSPPVHEPAGDDDRYRTWVRISSAAERAAVNLRKSGEAIFGEAIRIGSPDFGAAVRLHLEIAAGDIWESREAAGRFVVLGVWYLVAVHAWRHLAEMAGLAADDESFITWAGRDPEVAGALRFLASEHPKTLTRLSARPENERWRDGPGHLLGALAAAYSGTEPAEPIRPVAARVLAKCAADHQMTQPMAGLLIRLDPDALDSAFGPDVAADIDKVSGLEPGTAATVLRALLKPGRLCPPAEDDITRMLDRAARSLPVTADLPDYSGWHGPSVLAARTAATGIVRAGLGHSKWHPDDEYLRELRSLWTPGRSET